VTDDPTFLPPTPVRWGWWDVIYGLGAFLLTLTVSVIVAFGIDRNNPDAVGAFSLASAVLTYAALTAVLVVASRRRGLGSLAADFGLRFRPVDIAIGIGIGFAAKLFAVALTALAVSLTNHTPESGNFQLSTSTLWIVLNGFGVAALLAPVVEELFFRGLVLRSAHNRVLRRGGSKARAVAVAALASSAGFALLHLYESTDVTLLIILGGSTFALGLANSLVTLRTGRIGAGIIAHVFFNGSSVLLALLLR
jgi:membrane protease YdiL (CAAX protease family)